MKAIGVVEPVEAAKAQKVMRALVVAPQPFFTPRGTPFSVYYRTRAMMQLGAEVDILTYGEGADVDLLGARTFRIPRIRFFEPIRVGPSFPKLFLDIFLFFWTVGRLLRRRYDFVHAHEEAAFFCTLLKPLFRFKLVYDMHSRLPQQLINFGFTRWRWVISIFEFFEKAAMKNADAVITISPALADHVTSRMKHPDRHFLIENTIFDEVRLVSGSVGNGTPALQEELPVEKPIVAYAGTLERYQGMDLLIEAHAKVLEVEPDALLLVIGGSPEQVRFYEGMAERLGVLARCRFTGVLPQSQARKLLKSAAVVVSPRISGDNTPLKIYEQLACGIPLVATRIPSHTQVLGEEVCFLASPDPEDFSGALLEGLTNKTRRKQVVEAAKELYARKYSETAYVKKVSRLLKLLG